MKFPADRRAADNWWHYHWLAVVVAAVAAALVGHLIFSSVTAPRADLQVALIASKAYPDSALDALARALTPLTADENGDGERTVMVVQYTVNFRTDTAASTDASAQKAGVAGMLADLRGCYSQIFLLEDPDGFSRSTGALRCRDGTLPADGVYPDKAETCYRWADCPVLAGLDLGTYDSTLYGGTGSVQDLFGGLYVGSRGFWDGTATAHPEADEALWQTITAGALG